MKRKAIPWFSILRAAKWVLLVIILVGFAAICLGRRKARVSPLKIRQLAEPKLTGPVSFEQVLAKRRSVREFSGEKLDFVQIGQLAWAGQGITDKQSGFRTAPSAGAIYPIKLYFIMPEGMFVYNPHEHSLEGILSEDIRDKLAIAALNQEAVANAACDIIIAGSARQLAAKYRNKAERYMLLEAGHIAQNILLQAVSLELSAVGVGAFDMSQVRKLCKLPRILEPIYIICVGHHATERGEQEKPIGRMESTKAKRAVLIIASSNFRDEELFETRRELAEAGIETVIASTRTAVLRGMLGSEAEATILVDNIIVNDYDAIVFIGGSGASEYFNNRTALNITREAVGKRKVLAAICIAPGILANAGVLVGVKVTSFPSESLVATLRKNGAIYTGAAIERDRRIITAGGPMAASGFGRAIADALAGR